MKKILQKIYDFSELVVFKHVLFSSTFALSAMVVACLRENSALNISLKLFVLCALALVCARNFAMGFNRLVDKDIDKLNERTKFRPSVDGRVGFDLLSVFCVTNAVIFVLVAYFINTLAFYASIPILLVLGGYSLVKRFSFIAHIILGIALALAPIAVCIAIENDIELWCVMLSIGVMFWVSGFDCLYSLQDIDFDKKHGLHSMPSVFGVRNTLLLAIIFHILSVFFWILFVFFSDVLGLVSYVGVGLCALLLVYEHNLVHRDFINIPKAFFVLNSYIGILFLISVLVDGLLNYGI